MIEKEPLQEAVPLSGNFHAPHEPFFMTSINPSLPFLAAGLHLQDAVDTAPPVAIQTPPPVNHPPADRIPSHIMMGKEKIAVGSSKPLNSQQKPLLSALLKAPLDLKTVAVQGHTYEVDVKVVNKQLSHLTATCTSDPDQNIHNGNALALAFEPVAFPLNKLPAELQIEIAKHTATKEEGVSLGFTQANKSLRDVADKALRDGLRDLGYDNSEIQTISALPLSHRNFIVGSAKTLFAAGYDKASLLALASSPREQQRFVLGFHQLLSRHGHTGGTELNLVAASPRNDRLRMVTTLQHHERIRNEQLTLALENMRQNTRRINSGPAPIIEF